MTDYVDFVLVKMYGDKHVVVAPAWSDIKAHDEVIVDKEQCNVIAVATVSPTINSDVANLIIKACGEVVPLKKVSAKVEYRRYNYQQEEEPKEGE